MTPAAEFNQVVAIAKQEMRRAFFSKRSFWVYLLALFPAVIFFGHGMEVKFRRQRYASGNIVQRSVVEQLQRGMSAQEVLKAIGEPVRDREFTMRRRGGDEVEMRYIDIYDGERRTNLVFRDGILTSIHSRPLVSLEEDRTVFAGVFQYFFLRVGIFFGCLGIFLNLFRGEMLDKTLHFWLLAPARREVLLLGKYSAGLAAAAVIFTLSAGICFAAMMWAQDPGEAQRYWAAAGPSELARYLWAATLGCVGYGSVFLAAGLLVRNPIVPVVVVLFWEGINGFLPAMLQKFSVLYYLQSVCPVPAPVEEDTPAFVRLLLTPTEPVSVWTASLGLLALTALVLWAASRVVRKIEIDYATD